MGEKFIKFTTVLLVKLLIYSEARYSIHIVARDILNILLLILLLLVLLLLLLLLQLLLEIIFKFQI